MENKSDPGRGRRLATDPSAESARPGEPAFLARPAGAPVYHGFPILDDVEVDGFRLGMITDWETEPDVCGDAFVVAPDGSRAGLVWEVIEPPCFQEVMAPDASRWGVWAVGFPVPMTSRDNARRNLEAVIPELRSRWLQWKASESAESTS